MKKIFVILSIVLFWCGAAFAFPPLAPQISGTGGAPSAAYYYVSTADATLSNEIVLSANADSLLQAADYAAMLALLSLEEDDVEAFIFDADTQNVSGVWVWLDDVMHFWGTSSDAGIEWVTATNDHFLSLEFGESDGTNIPILNIADATFVEDTSTTNDDATEPGIRLWNDTADSWSLWGANDDGPQITIGGNATSFSIPDLAISFPITHTEDSGAITLHNMSVSATPADGVEESYSIQIDSNNILKLYSESVSDNSIDNLKMVLYGLAGEEAWMQFATNELTVVDGDKLGQIDFLAPLESSGTDAITVGASIWAEADAEFAADVNTTDLVFALGTSGAATEQMRIDNEGVVTPQGGVVIQETLSGDVADVTVDNSDVYGGILNNDGQATQACEFDLPAVVAGMSFIVVIGTDDDNNTYVHPNGTENMYLDGTAIGANERIVNANATMDVGDTLSCKAITTGGTVTWHCYTVVGTWADSGDDGD